MSYTPEQRKAAADANARTFVSVVLAAYFRRVNPTLTYRASLAMARALPMGERLAILVAAAISVGIPSAAIVQGESGYSKSGASTRFPQLAFTA